MRIFEAVSQVRHATQCFNQITTRLLHVCQCIEAIIPYYESEGHITDILVTFLVILSCY